MHTALKPQLQLDLRIPSRRPLLPMKAAMVFLDRNEDDVLALIQTGKIKWAFDLHCNGSKAHVHIYKGSAIAYRENRPEMEHDTIDVVIHTILGKRDPVRGVELKNLFSCDQKHIANLLAAGFLQRDPRSPSTNNHSPLITRSSIVALLKSRRIS